MKRISACLVRALNTCTCQPEDREPDVECKNGAHVLWQAPLLVSQNMHLRLKRILGTLGTPITGRIAMLSLK
jgi:hypothetical protein